MEEILRWVENSWDRLTDPALMFGLAVRFFGVFIVLIIVMIGIWLSGKIFIRMQENAKNRNAGSQGAQGQPAAQAISPGGAPPPSPAAGSSETAVPEETAAVIALSLARYLGEQPQGFVFTAGQSSSSSGQDSTWKLLGRQEAFSRNVPWSGVGSRKGR